jgi:exodeoxyribonuclease V gamma subunit
MPSAHLHRASDPDALVAALCRQVAAARASLHPVDAAFFSVTILVPGRLTEELLRRRLATTLGVAANIEATFPTAFLAKVVEANLRDVRLIDHRAWRGLLLDLVHDATALADPALAPVRRYLDGGGRPDDVGLDRRRLNLSDRLAYLFGEYALGSEGLTAAPPPDGWQRHLWELLLSRARAAGATLDEARSATTPPAAPRRWLTLPAALGELATADRLAGLPPLLHVFAPAPSDRLLPRVLPLLTRHAEVHVYHLEPPAGDVAATIPSRPPARKAKAGRRPSGPASSQLALFDAPPPAAESSAAAGPAVDVALASSSWARAARELDERLTAALPDAAFAPRVAGAPRPVLLERVRLFACPGVRREVESVAAEIWRLVRASEAGPSPLRFDEIAVVVPPADAELYATHVAAVFREAGDLPYRLADTSLGRASRLMEAIDVLLALPLGGFGRAEVLRLLTQPALLARFPEAQADDWLRFCEELGIVRGADRADHAGTYLTEDLFSWEQGLRRLAAGALHAPHRAAGVLLQKAEPLPAPDSVVTLDAAPDFALLVRSLIADARAAASARLPLREHCRLARILITTYLQPVTPDDERAMAACLAELASLGDLPADASLTYDLASQLIRRAFATLTGSQASHATRGVLVANYVQARGLPFRAIFLAGLGAGRFPAAETEDELDLRPDERALSPGDIDRGLFVDALGAASEHVVASYVARDAQTGDPIEPSSLLRELGEARDAARAPGAARWIEESTRPPLWRHEDLAAIAVLAAAAREVEARRRGHARAQAAPVPDDDAVFLGLLPARAPASGPGPVAPALGSRRAGAAPRPVRLHALRRFLECPLQGSATLRLGLRDGDDYAAAHTEDEPFAPSSLTRTVVLRRTFERALGRASREGDGALEGESLAAEHAATLAGPHLAGELPVGLFAQPHWLADLEVLAAWAADVRHVLAGAPVSVRRLDLGGCGREDAPGELGDPLRIQLASGQAVDLVGSTCPMLVLPDGALVSLALSVSESGKEVRNVNLREALRGYLDHLVLSMLRDPSAPPTAHRVLVSRPGRGASAGGAPYTHHLPALVATAARALLTDLLEESLGRVQAYLLPCEALFSWHFDAKKAKSVDELVADLRDNPFSSITSRRGPVPHSERYPIPTNADALAHLQRHFASFLREAVDE